jgi:hypothetical protein
MIPLFCIFTVAIIISFRSVLTGDGRNQCDQIGIKFAIGVISSLKLVSKLISDFLSRFQFFRITANRIMYLYFISINKHPYSKHILGYCRPKLSYHMTLMSLVSKAK